MTTQDPDKTLAAQAAMLAMLFEAQTRPLWSESKRVLAIETFGTFTALMKAGFTEEQALYLCKQ